jgi:hypothetical protein
MVPLPLHAGVESLPPGHWAYAELEHFEARGRVRLDGLRPWSRQRVRGWVEVLAASPPDWTPVERARLRRLVAEFVDGDSLDAGRWDPALLVLADGAWKFAGDIELGGGGDAGRGAATSGWGETRVETLLRWGDLFAYQTRYRASLAEETGRRTGENRLSSRQRTWHGLVSDNDLAYLACERGRLRVSFGREYLAWGPGRDAALLVSDAGTSLDGLQVRLRLGRFTLASAVALLAAERNRHWAAHRLETDCGPLLLGVHEAVVYDSPLPDPAYWFPISFYYGNQFNERADDNVLLGADLAWRSRWGVLSGELLVDDFIYDGDPAPQKIGWRLGAARGLAVGGTDVDVQLGYVRLNRWTYTHRRAVETWVAGGGDPAAGDPFLGHPLGPDADRWTASAVWWPSPRWTLSWSTTRTRRGDGNWDLSAWQSGDPYRVDFPSGRVVASTASEFAATLRWGRQAELRAATVVTGAPRTVQLRAEVRLDL